MTTVQYPSLFVPGSSSWWFSSLGPNGKGGTGLVDRSGASFTNANATAFLTIVGPTGTTLLNQAAIAYQSPGFWLYQVAATVCITKGGDWVATCQVFGPGGTGDTLQREFFYTLREKNDLL